MSRNVIHVGTGSHSPQTPTGRQALSRALAGGALGDKNASPAPTGNAHAKRPIDGLSRPLRSLPVMNGNPSFKGGCQCWVDMSWPTTRTVRTRSDRLAAFILSMTLAR
jgi:hypothetical protein